MASKCVSVLVIKEIKKSEFSPVLAIDDNQCYLRWLSTIFDTHVSFTLFSKTFDPLVAKNSSKQVNNTNFGVLIVKLTYVSLPWQHE